MYVSLINKILKTETENRKQRRGSDEKESQKSGNLFCSHPRQRGRPPLQQLQRQRGKIPPVGGGGGDQVENDRILISETSFITMI